MALLFSSTILFFHHSLLCCELRVARASGRWHCCCRGSTWEEHVNAPRLPLQEALRRVHGTYWYDSLPKTPPVEGSWPLGCYWFAAGLVGSQWALSGRCAIFSGHFQLLQGRGSSSCPCPFSFTSLSPLLLPRPAQPPPTFFSPSTTPATLRRLSPSPSSSRLSNPRLTLSSSSSKLPLPNRPPPASSLDTSSSYLPLPQPTPFSLPTSHLPRPRQRRRARPTSTLTKPLLQRPLTFVELLSPPFRLCHLLFDTGY